MKATKYFVNFFNNEKAGGILLIACTIVSLFFANSSFGDLYVHLWEYKFAGLSIEHWINDALMAIFFLLIGLELKREFIEGELSSLDKALLPVFGALGGMIFPALIFLLFNWGTAFQSGAGIPMATDIAFAIGVLSLFGKRVPTSLKVFLTALAVIDDLGAIIVIALFYTKTLVLDYLLLAGLSLLFLYVLNRLKVKRLFLYLIGGAILWFFVLKSGIHATIAGVLLAFVIPQENNVNETSLSEALEEKLHIPVAFFILPLFAFANTAIVFQNDLSKLLTNSLSIGIALGLILGKSFGIFSFTFFSVKMKICKLENELNWLSIFSVSILGGIGFTMSIFIALLAFDDVQMITMSKIAILLSSSLAALLGIFFLNYALGKKAIDKD